MDGYGIMSSVALSWKRCLRSAFLLVELLLVWRGVLFYTYSYYHSDLH